MAVKLQTNMEPHEPKTGHNVVLTDAGTRCEDEERVDVGEAEDKALKAISTL